MQPGVQFLPLAVLSLMAQPDHASFTRVSPCHYRFEGRLVHEAGECDTSATPDPLVFAALNQHRVLVTKFGVRPGQPDEATLFVEFVVPSRVYDATRADYWKLDKLISMKEAA